MRRLLSYFIRGLVFLAPVAITLYACVFVFRTVDGWLGLPIPGAGFAASLVLVTLFGFLGSSFITRSAIAALDEVLERLPFVRLLYSSTRDLVSAFVGDKRRFDKPVLVRIWPESEAMALGFVTQESLEPLGLATHVAVYMPHSYNFSGQMYVVPRSAVRPIEVSSSEYMAFIVSGGVTEVPKLGAATPVSVPTIGDAAHA